MPTVAFLACETTLPGVGQRRGDAFEHDLMLAALEPAFIQAGLGLRVIDWEAPLGEFAAVEAVLLGTAWNYQDKADEFLRKLEALEARGIEVFNPPDVVRWNLSKTYLRELEEAGAATIPTIWLDDVTIDDAVKAMDSLACDKVVVKRQIGAGALGQELVERAKPRESTWRYGHRAMVQPYLPAIQSEGELSFIFISGEFSHALRKRPACGDYRIQSLYGGREDRYEPTENDFAAARAIIEAVPFPAPLYARIDMLRGDDDQLMVMEAELIEPYLYPEQGPELGQHLARAIIEKVCQK